MKYVRRVLDYSPDTGKFKWKVRMGQRGKIGSEAGSLRRGYRVIKVAGFSYPAHRLAWLWMRGRFPEKEIDHINGTKDDNRWANLREVDRSTNVQNQRRARKDSKVGLIGVSRAGSRYRAFIRKDGKRHELGCFGTPEAAHRAYVEAKRELHSGCTI